jgi:hypothetical protein
MQFGFEDGVSLAAGYLPAPIAEGADGYRM